MLSALSGMLVSIDFLKSDNPEYWLLPVRKFIDRVGLRRREFDMIELQYSTDLSRKRAIQLYCYTKMTNLAAEPDPLCQ